MVEYDFEPDYVEWWDKKDLNKEQFCWLMLGVNPDDVKKKQKFLDAQKETPSAANSEEGNWNRAFGNYCNSLPDGMFLGHAHKQRLEILSDGISNEELAQETYEFYFDIVDGFKDVLIKRDALKKNNALEKFRDHQQYKLDFEGLELGSIENEEQAFAVLLGVEPSFFSKFLALVDRYENEPKQGDYAPYINFKPEDKWFFSEYRKFIVGFYQGWDHYTCVTNAYRNAKELGLWGGDFKQYYQDMHDAGFIFKQEVCKKLSEQMAVSIPCAVTESWALNFYRRWLSEGGWTLEEAAKLFKGIDPRQGKRSFCDLSQPPALLDTDSDYLFIWDMYDEDFINGKERLELDIAAKNIVPLEGIDKQSFRPNEIISWFLKHSLHTPPEALLVILREKGFNGFPRKNDEYPESIKEISVNKVLFQKRRSELHDCIGQVWNDLKTHDNPKPSAADVWKSLKSREAEFTCITRFFEKNGEEAVEWISPHGNNSTLQYSSFPNIVTGYNTGKKTLSSE